MVTSSTIISECAQVKFDVLNDSHSFGFEDAREFALDLAAANEKTSLIFKEIVASRSAIVEQEDGFMEHEHYTWYERGPIDFDTFLNLLNYDSQDSNELWLVHLELSVEPPPV